MKQKTINKISIVIYFLFWPFFQLAKKIRKEIFESKKQQAIAEADKRHLNTGKKIFVVQNGKEFLVGTRETFRRMNTKKGKEVKGTGLYIDYRKAIIYQTR